MRVKASRKFSYSIKEWEQNWKHKHQSLGNYKSMSLKERPSLDKVTLGASLVNQLDEGRGDFLISERKEGGEEGREEGKEEGKKEEGMKEEGRKEGGNREQMKPFAL